MTMHVNSIDFNRFYSIELYSIVYISNMRLFVLFFHQKYDKLRVVVGSVKRMSKQEREIEKERGGERLSTL